MPGEGKTRETPGEHRGEREEGCSGDKPKWWGCEEKGREGERSGGGGEGQMSMDAAAAALRDAGGGTLQWACCQALLSGAGWP